MNIFTKQKEILEIFKPLEIYFKILYNFNYIYDSEFSFNIDKKRDREELIEKLGRKNCDKNKELTENFKDSLLTFVSLLIKADGPIGIITIKDELLKIFKSVNLIGIIKDNKIDKNKIKEIIKSIIEKCKENKESLSDFNIESDNGNNKTYSQILLEILEKVQNKDTMEIIFNKWFNESFNTYDYYYDYFNNNIKNKYTNLEEWQYKLLDTFFEIKLSDSSTLKCNNYFDNINTYKDYKARLNLKINDIEHVPVISQLFPLEIRRKFNTYLIKLSSKKSNFGPTECSKQQLNMNENKWGDNLNENKNSQNNIKLSKSKDKKNVQFNIDDFSEILKFTEEIIKNARKENNVTKNNVTENKESPNKDVDFKNIWKADSSGDLFKKNDKTHNFEKYTEKDYRKEEPSSKCLYIFNDINKCNEFFQSMIRDTTLSIDKLSEIINQNNFKDRLNELKNNIINVNPAYVLGTLKIFGFGFVKSSSLKEDGSRTLKIENFDTWWDKYSTRINIKNSVNNNTVFENLKSFFNLLITFINNNEFVLNPETKELINKSGKPTFKINKKPLEYFTINGVQVKNNFYEEELALAEGKSVRSSKPESLSNLLKTIRKNSLLKPQPINFELEENSLNIASLLNLIIQSINGQKINLPFLSGKGYGHLNIGGAGSEDNIHSENFLPCTQNALEIYKIGIEALKKKNKSLDAYTKNYISDIIGQLGKSEREVYDSLDILTNYIRVINIMPDETKNDTLTIKIMDNANKNYYEKCEECIKKSSSTINDIITKLEISNKK